MNLTGILIFYFVLTSIFILLDIYSIRKLSHLVKKRNWNKWISRSSWILSLIFLVLWLVFIPKRFSMPIPQPLESTIFKIVSFWYLPKILILIFFLPSDIFKFFKCIYLKIKGLFHKKLNTEVIMNNQILTGRRKFVQNTALGIAGIPYLLAFKGLVYTTNELKVIRIEIPLYKLPKQLEGLRIVQLSDLHFGSFDNPEIFRQIRFMVNNLQPDMVMITGDFVNFSPKELPNGFDEIANINSKYGIFACFGNHDHYMSDDDHKELIKQIKSKNINLLINENIELNINYKKLNIVGIDNLSKQQKFGDINKAFAGISPAHPTILLCHDPKNWEPTIINSTFADLTLSGHTHGGQIAFELFGSTLTPAQFAYKHYAGLYNIKDKYLYVNRGIGTSGPPLRLGMNPEITVITLKTTEDWADSGY